MAFGVSANALTIASLSPPYSISTLYLKNLLPVLLLSCLSPFARCLQTWGTAVRTGPAPAAHNFACGLLLYTLL
jgi:hypothetical protein